MHVTNLLRMAALAAALIAFPVRAQVPPAADILMFSREGCPHCADAKVFLANLAQRRPELRIEIRDVEQDPAALALLRSLAEEHAVRGVAVPAFLIHDRMLVGFQTAETTGREIERMLEGAHGGTTGAGGTCELTAAAEPCALEEPVEGDAVDLPIFGRLRVQEVGLPALTIAIGLIDGFNPCAMWVLLFLLSILVGLRNRARMFAIGGVFVLTSGLVYFAFMAAWLNVFLLIGVTRWIQLTLGLIAVAIGMLNVKDVVAFGRGFSIGIPESAKPGLYARTRSVLKAPSMVAALLGAAVLAAAVNTVELLCTAGLPAIYTQILSVQGLSTFAHYAYLALYNLAYMADDLLMLTIAVATLSNRRLQQGGARLLKFVSGAAMLALGVVLLFRPAWLAF